MTVTQEQAQALVPAPDEKVTPGEWASLMADLGPGEERPVWRMHDRTHLELALGYPVGAGEGVAEARWEAYFFLPESLRVGAASYDPAALSFELHSYVRLAAPDVPFADLADAPVDSLLEAFGGPETRAVRELRIFACAVRASGSRARRTIAEGLEGAAGRAAAVEAAAAFVRHARRLSRRLQEVLGPTPGDTENLATARALVAEDVSRLLETLLASLARELERVDAAPHVRAAATDAAVEQARYRDAAGMDGVVREEPTPREVEHHEFRRGVLKRFTSSVLWLSASAYDPSKWVEHVLYAVAAGVAMAFALVAAFWNGFAVDPQRLWVWSAAAVVAYMGKDRIKAVLQTASRRFVSSRYPDRRWRLCTRGGKRLGHMDERSGFVADADVPPDVLAVRRAGRETSLLDEARPESILRHQKSLRLSREAVRALDPRFHGVTEIFRLDLRRWLAHTDDPKRDILFADPVGGVLRTRKAPRVYNISIVYRLTHGDGEPAPWQRVRVVVSRKGIRRVEQIFGQ